MNADFKSKAIVVSLKIGLILGILLVLSNLCSWTITGHAWLYSQASAAKRLSKVLPIIKEYDVEYYRNQGWCKVFFYQNGTYWETTIPTTTTCVLGPDIPISPFTKAATADFIKLKKDLFFTGLRICWIIVEYDNYGEISYVEFELEQFFLPWYARFIYSPMETPSSKGGEAENYYIMPGWYFTIEDWL